VNPEIAIDPSGLYLVLVANPESKEGGRHGEGSNYSLRLTID